MMKEKETSCPMVIGQYQSASYLGFTYPGRYFDCLHNPNEYFAFELEYDFFRFEVTCNPEVSIKVIPNTQRAGHNEHYTHNASFSLLSPDVMVAVTQDFLSRSLYIPEEYQIQEILKKRLAIWSGK